MLCSGDQSFFKTPSAADVIFERSLFFNNIFKKVTKCAVASTLNCKVCRSVLCRNVPSPANISPQLQLTLLKKVKENPL